MSLNNTKNSKIVWIDGVGYTVKIIRENIETAVPKLPRLHGDNPTCPNCSKILEKYSGKGKNGCTVCPDPECRQVIRWFQR